MKTVEWLDYYEKLADYYYDNIEYDHPSPKQFLKWVEDTFNCKVDERRQLIFYDDRDHFRFIWRWM